VVGPVSWGQVIVCVVQALPLAALIHMREALAAADWGRRATASRARLSSDPLIPKIAVTNTMRIRPDSETAAALPG